MCQPLVAVGTSELIVHSSRPFKPQLLSLEAVGTHTLTASWASGGGTGYADPSHFLVRVGVAGAAESDLHTFDTRLDTTLELAEQVPGDHLVITESGIHTRDDVRLMRKNGINGFLVGEAFMRAEDPGAALKALFF